MYKTPALSTGISFVGQLTVGQPISKFLQEEGIQSYGQSMHVATSGAAIGALSIYGSQMYLDQDISYPEALVAAGAVALTQIALGDKVFDLLREAGVAYKLIAPLYTAGATGLTALAFEWIRRR